MLVWAFVLMRGKEAGIWLTHRRRVRIFFGILFRHSMEWCRNVMNWSSDKEKRRQKRRVERFRSIGLIYGEDVAVAAGCLEMRVTISTIWLKLSAQRWRGNALLSPFAASSVAIFLRLPFRPVCSFFAFFFKGCHHNYHLLFHHRQKFSVTRFGWILL